MEMPRARKPENHNDLSKLAAHIEHVKAKLAAYGNNDTEFSNLESIFSKAQRGDVSVENAIELADSVFDDKNLR